MIRIILWSDNYKASTGNCKSSGGNMLKNAIKDVKKISSNNVIINVTKKNWNNVFIEYLIEDWCH